MGKRKKSSRKPTGPRKRDPLPSTFECLFCNHEKCVVIKLDKKLGLGNLECNICGQRFQTGVNYLSAPVDVYADWVDACESVAKNTAAAQLADRAEYAAVPAGGNGSGAARRSPGAARNADQDADEYDYGNDDFVVGGGAGGDAGEGELSDY
ncbi:Uracil phosphoribosyltransferase, synthesizes UMP from uracil [Ascosphaera pollenicola]|nr:Uracil phosphoribosyltransferase, synthesizes UMP from uracil [Ascosphaera pollenicola]